MDKDNKTNVNYGICILRPILCFSVILSHLWGRFEIDKPLLFKLICYLGEYAVPIFMFMSFFLCTNNFLKRNKSYYKKRILRLTIPSIFWGGTSFIVFFALQSLFKMDFQVKFGDLFYQILFGASVNGALWYMFDVILITVAFFSIIHFNNEHRSIVILYFAMIAAIVIQYTGTNYYLFGSLDSKIKWSLGRIAEMIPYAVLGFIFSYYGLLNRKKSCKMILIYVLFFVTFALTFFLDKSFLSNGKNFYYSGVTKIIGAVIVFSITYYIPLYRLPEKIKKVLLSITKYTLGIYCMHMIVLEIVCKIIGIYDIELNCYGIFLTAVFIYIFCWMISYFIEKLPFKICKKLVD